MCLYRGVVEAGVLMGSSVVNSTLRREAATDRVVERRRALGYIQRSKHSRARLRLRVLRSEGSRSGGLLAVLKAKLLEVVKSSFVS